MDDARVLSEPALGTAFALSLIGVGDTSPFLGSEYTRMIRSEPLDSVVSSWLSARSRILRTRPATGQKSARMEGA